MNKLTRVLTCHWTTMTVVLSVLALSPVGSHAQSAFIEVVVTDTMVLNFTSFTYRIQSGKSTSFMGMRLPGTDDTEAKEPKVDLDIIRLLLDRNDFDVAYDTLPLDGTTSSWPGLGTDEPKESIVVQVRNHAQMMKLRELLSDMKGFTGTAENVKYESQNKYLPSFHQSVIINARLDAEAIAAAGQLTLGKVIAVTERTTTEGMSDYMQLMERMMKKGFDMSSSSDVLRKEVVRTMVVRFAAN
ncbi:MAG TPA: hypothetical protein PK760_08070 [Flavobacteriales bacterium]|nr:hypothetical protein [Flavobacteriales bacterium]